MRYDDSRPFVATFLIPHCTSFAASVWQLVQLYFLPPLFCVLLAFFVVFRQPGALHVWGMSALLLAMSQLDLFPHAASFQSTANTMAWTDGFRIPATVYRAFAQNIWPAALIVTASHLLPVKPATRMCSRWLATLLLGWCLVQSLLAVGWSEYYMPFVPLYDSVQQHSAKLTSSHVRFGSGSMLHPQSKAGSGRFCLSARGLIGPLLAHTGHYNWLWGQLVADNSVE